MLLLLLIVCIWTVGLLLVAGLCAAARRGDVELVREARAQEPAAAAPARTREAPQPTVRVAA